MNIEEIEYKCKSEIANANKYNPTELIKPENSRILFEVINEAEQCNKLKFQLDIANKKLDKINAIATINEIFKESDLSNLSDKRELLNYEKELMSIIKKLSIIGGE